MSGTESYNWASHQAVPFNPLQTYKDVVSIQGSQLGQQLTQQQLENARLDTQQKDQELKVSRNGYIAGRLHSLAYLPMEQQTPELYNQVLRESLALGADPNAVQAYSALVARARSPAELQQLAMRTGLQLVSPQVQQQMAGHVGTMETKDANGNPVHVGTFQPGAGMPNAGAIETRGGGVPMTMSPSEGWQTVSLPDGKGGENHWFKRQLDANNQPLPGEQPQSNTPAPGTGGATTGGGGGPTGPSGPTGPAPTPGGPSGPTGPAPGSTRTAVNLPQPVVHVPANQADQLKKDSEEFNKVLQSAPQMNQNISDLVEAYNLVKALTTSGAGQDWVNKYRGYISTWARRFNIDVGDLADENARYDLANKILTRVQLNTPGAGQSVVALETAGGATPNLSHMDHDAALSAIRTNVGQWRQYLGAAMEHPDKNGVGFSVAQPEYNNKTDREGFAADLMTKDEVSKHFQMLGGKFTNGQPDAQASSPAAMRFYRSLSKLHNTFQRDPGSSLGLPAL